MAERYLETRALKWPIVLDDKQELYRHYRFPRSSWWTLLKPVVIWKYLVNILTGHFPGPAGKDVRQLGGNVLIDDDSIVAMNHVSINPHARPDASHIFDLVVSPD